MAFIQHRINVSVTSLTFWRCIDVNMTLYKRHVPTGKEVTTREYTVQMGKEGWDFFCQGSHVTGRTAYILIRRCILVQFASAPKTGLSLGDSTLSMLGKTKISRPHFKMFFLFSPENRFDISYNFSWNAKAYFSGENKKNIIYLSLAE